MNSLSFDMPPVTPNDPRPVWNGWGFEIGRTRSRILSYDTGISGWNDDLTKLHEDETASGSHFIDMASRRRALAHLERYGFRPASSILEVGVSAGHFLEDVRRRFPEAAVLGSDYTLGTLIELAPRMEGVPLIRMDLTRSPFPDAAVDAIVLLNVLEHIDADELAIRHCFRMLKPGGLMVVEVPAGPHLYDDYDRELMHFRRYSSSELVAKAERAGFRVLETSFLGCLIYPAFWLSKKWARRKSKPPGDAAASKVRSAIRATIKVNHFGHWIMRAEDWLARHIRLPFGIRCVLVGQKP